MAGHVQIHRLSKSVVDLHASLPAARLYGRRVLDKPCVDNMLQLPLIAVVVLLLLHQQMAVASHPHVGGHRRGNGRVKQAAKA